MFKIYICGQVYSLVCLCFFIQVSCMLNVYVYISLSAAQPNLNNVSDKFHNLANASIVMNGPILFQLTKFNDNGDYTKLIQFKTEKIVSNSHRICKDEYFEVIFWTFVLVNLSLLVDAIEISLLVGKK